MVTSSCFSCPPVPSGLNWPRLWSTQFERFDCPQELSLKGPFVEIKGLVSTCPNWPLFRPVGAEKSRVKSGEVGVCRVKSGEKKLAESTFLSAPLFPAYQPGYPVPLRLHDFRSSLYHAFFRVRVLFSVVRQNWGGKGQLGRLKVCTECVGQDFSYVCWTRVRESLRVFACCLKGKPQAVVVVSPLGALS